MGTVLAGQVNLRSQHCAGGVLRYAIGQGAVDQDGEPAQLERIGQLVAAFLICLGQRCAAGTVAIRGEATKCGKCLFDGLGALLGSGNGMSTAVQREFAGRKVKRPAFGIGKEGNAECCGAIQNDLFLIVGTGYALGYHDVRHRNRHKAAVAVAGCCCQHHRSSRCRRWYCQRCCSLLRRCHNKGQSAGPSAIGYQQAEAARGCSVGSPVAARVAVGPGVAAGAGSSVDSMESGSSSIQ